MAKGDEAFRRELVSRARVFKRSWVDMAEALVEVRSGGYYQRWGYETLHGYALEELHIKRSTVDKLTGSYHALEQHVPHVLSWDGVAQSMPEMEAVEFFAKAVDPPSKNGERAARPSKRVVEDLKQAIFEEQASTPSLRRRFNPILNPREPTDERRELLERVRASAKRLSDLVTEVDGLSEERVEQVVSTMEELRRDIDELA